MGGFNQDPFNTQEFNGPSPPLPPPFPPPPGPGPYDYPQITINAPISPPPQELCNTGVPGAGPTITGPTDGVNNLFTWQVVFSRIQVYRNGVAQTIGRDFSNGPTALVFLPGSIPQLGDLVTVYGWA